MALGHQARRPPMIARQHAAVESPDRERRALVLAGGGIIGMLYEIGVLAALEEAFPPGPFNEHFDLFVGTSAGAVTAAFVANGAQPSEMFRALRDDLDSPFNFRPEDVFATPAGNMIQFFTQFAQPLLGTDRGARRIVYVIPFVPIRSRRGKVCFPLDAGGCGRLSDRGIGWIADQTLRMFLAAQLPAAPPAVQARYPGLVVQNIEPFPDELPMFLHHAMSFDARRELLDYGYACGQRTAPAAPPSPSAQRGFLP